MIRLTLFAVALLACGNKDEARERDEPKPAPTAEQALHKIDKLQIVVPDGWTAKYDAEWDKWLLESKLAGGRTANVRIERAPPSAVASPDAYVAQLHKYWDTGTTAEFEKRESVKGGFAMTLVVRAAADPTHPKRETYVIRELGSVWYQCLSEWVPDDAVRDQVLSLCKSLKL